MNQRRRSTDLLQHGHRTNKELIVSSGGCSDQPRMALCIEARKIQHGILDGLQHICPLSVSSDIFLSHAFPRHTYIKYLIGFTNSNTVIVVGLMNRPKRQ